MPPGARWDVLVTEADNGLDLQVSANHAPGPDASMALAIFAEAEDIARVSWLADDGVEPVAVCRAPMLDLSGTSLELSPGAFLQASAEAERILSGLVCDAVQGDRIADLYCGVGTFALPLAAGGAKAFAVDGEGAAVEAMTRAASTAEFGGQISIEIRDLVRRSMMADDLKHFDTVVFDPPRAGAPQSGGRNRQITGATGDRRLVQPGDLCEGCRRIGRGRFHVGNGDPGGPVRLVRPCGARGGVFTCLSDIDP